jgi:hypothetical protein
MHYTTDDGRRLLDGTSNRQTRLTVNTRPVMDGARQVTVLPTGIWMASQSRASSTEVGGDMAQIPIYAAAEKSEPRKRPAEFPVFNQETFRDDAGGASGPPDS